RTDRPPLRITVDRLGRNCASPRHEPAAFHPQVFLANARRAGIEHRPKSWCPTLLRANSALPVPGRSCRDGCLYFFLTRQCLDDILAKSRNLFTPLTGGR